MKQLELREGIVCYFAQLELREGIFKLITMYIELCEAILELREGIFKLMYACDQI